MALWELYGTPYEMGCQMGQKSRSDIIRMCEHYPVHVVLQFIEKESRENVENCTKGRGQSYHLAYQRFKHALPKEYMEELWGIVKTVRHKKGDHSATFCYKLWWRTIAIADLHRRLQKLLKKMKFKIPDMCNVYMGNTYYMEGFPVS